jgi:hypothetical protein
MSFPSATQTIWEGDEYGDGEIRRITAHKSAMNLWLGRSILSGEHWLTTSCELRIGSREQAIAVREALNTYLEETSPPPKPATCTPSEVEAMKTLICSISQKLVAVVEAMALIGHPDTEAAIQQSMGYVRQLNSNRLTDRLIATEQGIAEICASLSPTRSWAQRQRLKASWPLMQAANRLAEYCRSVRLDTKLSPGPDDNEPKCWQMEGWCLGLLEEADRVAVLIDWVMEPIEPVPPRGGNPIKWDAKHVAAPDIDLIVDFGEEAFTNTPTWSVSDEFGEVIYLELAGLAWLAELLPRVLESYRSHLVAMEGGSNGS